MASDRLTFLRRLAAAAALTEARNTTDPQEFEEKLNQLADAIVREAKDESLRVVGQMFADRELV